MTEDDIAAFAAGATSTRKPDRGVMVQRIQVLNQAETVVGDGEFVMLLKRR